MRRFRASYCSKYEASTVGATAATLFVIAGTKMTAIESVSGDSIDELYYQAFGMFSYGMAALSALAVVPFIGAVYGSTSTDWSAPTGQANAAGPPPT